MTPAERHALKIRIDQARRERIEREDQIRAIDRAGLEMEREKRRALEPRACSWCGVEFQPGQATQIFCTRSHATLSWIHKTAQGRAYQERQKQQRTERRREAQAA